MDDEKRALSDHPVISLIVSTIGRPDDMRRLLESIETELGTGLQAELIVVDQSADDRTLAILEDVDLSIPCTYLRSGIGVSVGRNVGLEHARGTYVMFPDDDVWFSGGFLETAVEFLDAERQIDGFCGRLVTDEGTDSQLRWAKTARYVTARNHHRTSIGPAMVFRREVVVAAGGYEEDIGTGSPGWYGACEDSDLILRLIESGSPAWYEPGAVLHHREVRFDTGPVAEAKSVLYGCGQGHLWRVRRFNQLWVLAMMSRRFVGSLGHTLAGRRSLGRVRRAWLRGAICGLLDVPPAGVGTADEPAPEAAPRSGGPDGAEFVTSFKWRVIMAGAGVVASFGLTAYAARTLPAGELSLFLVLLVALSLSPSLTRLGVNHDAVRSLASARAAGGWHEAVRVGRLTVRSCLLPTVVIGPVVAVLVVATGERDLLLTWVLVTVVLVTDSLRLTYSDVFLGLGMARWSAMLAHQIRPIAVAVAIVVDRIVVADDMTLTRLLVLMSVVGVGLVGVGAVRLLGVSLGMSNPAGSVARGRVERGRDVAAGLPFLVVDVVGVVIARGDVWLSAVVFDEGQAVLYGTSAILANQVASPVGLASVALAPIVAGYMERGQTRALEQLVRRLATALAVFLIPLFAITLISGDAILATVYGDGFREAHALLVILMLGNVSFVVLGMGSVLLVMAGGQRLAMRLSLWWVGVVVGATVIAAVLGGPTALAVASSLSSTGFLVLLAGTAWAVTGVRVYPTLHPREPTSTSVPVAASP